jgi:hypothetical protein
LPDPEHRSTGAGRGAQPDHGRAADFRADVLLAQISSTPNANGYYSPYIGAVVDVARILSTAHTAQYQYIPALACPTGRTESPAQQSAFSQSEVRRNGPPPVVAAPVPPLRAIDPAQILRAGRPFFSRPTGLHWSLPPTSRTTSFCILKPSRDLELICRRNRIPCVVVSRRDPALAVGGAVRRSHRDASWRMGLSLFEGPHYRLRPSRLPSGSSLPRMQAP